MNKTSIIVLCHNEQDLLPELFARLDSVAVNKEANGPPLWILRDRGGNRGGGEKVTRAIFT